jgi:hypothetical protein
MIRLQLSLKDLDTNNEGGGLEIVIPGVIGDPTIHSDWTAESIKGSPIFLEYNKGRLMLRVWNGQEDPQTIEIKINPKISL